MGTRWRRAAGLAGAVGVAVLAAACDPGPNLQLQVNAFDDRHDAVPGDGVCEATPGTGDCTLRAAVEEANATAADLPTGISLPAGTYALTEGPLVADRQGGLLTLTADPAGATVTSDDGVLDALDAQVTFVRTTLVGGDRAVEVAGGARVALLSGGASGTSAAMTVHPLGEGVVHDATLTASAGCALHQPGGLGASLLVDQSTIEGLCLEGGSATVTDTTIAGDLDVVPVGIGSFNDLQVELDGATVVGGAVVGAPDWTTQTHARVDGSVFESGLTVTGEAWVTVDDSTVVGDLLTSNLSHTYNYWTGVTVTGHTQLDGVINEFRSSTLAGGVTLGDIPEGRFISSTLTSDGTRPALTISYDALRTVVYGSIVDGGSAAACETGVDLEDPWWSPDVWSAWNVFSDETCYGFWGTGDRSSVDPQLGPLQDNGGPTMTRLPAPGSPAIDAVPVGSVGPKPPSWLLCGDGVVDQRGLARPQGAACDHGAVEQ